MHSKLYQAISRRKSVRDFSAKSISAHAISEIENFIKNILPLSDKKIGIRIIKNEKEILTTSLITPLGSFISNAPYFAAVYAHEDQNSIVEAGYQSEFLVLNLTDHHFASCYIGGFLNFAYLEKKLRIPAPQKLLIIIPFGHLSNSFMGLWTNSVIETGKFLMGESGRKPLNQVVFYQHWSKSAEDYLKNETVLKQIFEKTCLAPSGANLQPWRFLIKDNVVFAFSISTLKGKLVGNETLWGRDYRNFDLGIALSHFAIAAKEHHYPGKWDLNVKLSDLERKELKIPAESQLIAAWK